MKHLELAVFAAITGVCETPGVAPENNIPPGVQASLSALPASTAAQTKQKILGVLGEACAQSMQGFEMAYRVTFYASLAAMVLAAFLPGWPGKWGGRASTQPGVGGH